MFPPPQLPGGAMQQGQPPQPGGGMMSQAAPSPMGSQPGPSAMMAALGMGGPVQQSPMQPMNEQPGDLGPLLQMVEQAQAQGIPPQALLALLSQGGGPMGGMGGGMGGLGAMGGGQPASPSGAQAMGQGY